MKRTIVCFLICVSLLVSSGVGAFAQNISDGEAIEITYEVIEDFNALANGATSPKFVFAPKQNSVAVAPYPSEDDKSLRFKITTTSDSHVDANLSSLVGKVVIDFDVMFDSVADAQFSLYTKNANLLESELIRFERDLSLRLPTGELVANLVPQKFYNISLVISTEDLSMDIYINHKKKAADAYVNSRVKDGLYLLRFHCLGVGEGTKPTIYLDNVAVYKSEYPVFKLLEMGYILQENTMTDASGIATNKEVKAYMENAVAFYVDKPRMYSTGKVRAIDTAPMIVNDRAHVPVRAVADGFGAEVVWAEDSQTIAITYGEKEIILTVGDTTITVNGELTETDSAPFIYDSRAYLPLRAVAEAMGKKATYDDSGLIVLADREEFFDYRGDLGIFRKLAGDLAFEDYDAVEMLNVGAHPRLFATSDDISAIRAKISTDANMSAWYADVKKSADNYLKMNCVTYEIPDGIRLLEVSREAQTRIEILSFVYQISGDKSYAERALKEMLAVCAFKDWNPYHFLDTAEMMAGVAFGYDWIYDTMSAEDKKTVETAIYEKGIRQALEDYEDVTSRNRSYKWAQSNVGDNWNVVCNSGSLQAAIAIADVYPEASQKVFGYGMELLKKAVLLYGPDGAWYEGPGYWEYTTRYFCNLMACLESAYGTTFGYMDIPGIKETGYYVTALTGADSVFNFHDVGEAPVVSSTQFFLASHTGSSSLNQTRLNDIKKLKILGTVRDLLWYEPQLSSVASEIPLDFYFKDTEVATMRNSWNTANAVFVGLHAGNTNVYHGHMDSGSIVLDGYGSRFISDLGSENYNLAGGQWDKYRNRAEGHNTLVINPGLDGGQNIGGQTRIDRFETNASSAIAVVDMTSMYSNTAESVKRGIKFTDNRKAIIMQDEIVNKQPYDVWWAIHTKYTPELAADSKSVIIHGDNRNLKLTIIGNEDAQFTIMNAEPLPTSPVLDGQSSNLLYKKVAINLKDVTSTTICVRMDFLAPMEEGKIYSDDIELIDNWTLDEEVTEAEKPKLSSLCINGDMVEEFDPDTLSYSYVMEFDEELPEIKAEGNGDIEIENTGSVPGHFVITVKSHTNENVKETYTIALKRKLASQPPKCFGKYEISSVEASAIPQPENSPENTFDGSLDTRWSANGNASITYDLGEIKNIRYLGLAIYQDTNMDGRMQFFDVLVSQDGKEFTKIYSDNTSGSTIEQEVFEIPESKARFVRIYCKGTSVGTWNSITECNIYGR